MRKIALLLITLISVSAFAVKPTDYSDQLDLLRSGDSVAITDAGGVVVKYFSHTTTAITNGQSVAIAEIPANSRIIGGHLSMAAHGGAQAIDVGLIAKDGGGYINKPTTTADDTDLLLNDVACSNAVADTFCDFAAGDYDGYAGFDTDVYLAVTANATAWEADKALVGWVMYIKGNN